MCSFEVGGSVLQGDPSKTSSSKGFKICQSPPATVSEPTGFAPWQKNPSFQVATASDETALEAKELLFIG